MPRARRPHRKPPPIVHHHHHRAGKPARKLDRPVKGVWPNSWNRVAFRRAQKESRPPSMLSRLHDLWARAAFLRTGDPEMLRGATLHPTRGWQSSSSKVAVALAEEMSRYGIRRAVPRHLRHKVTSLKRMKQLATMHLIGAVRFSRSFLGLSSMRPSRPSSPAD